MTVPLAPTLEPLSRRPMSLPIETRFPAIARVHRAEFGAFPSPVEEVRGLPGGRALWLKRDDLVMPPAPGNKVRALEYLLADVRRGDTVVTVGGEGSTHVLATALLGEMIGARVLATRWPHDMSDRARTVAAAANARCAVTPASGAVGGMLSARWSAFRSGARYIPLGGSIPLGILGHVNAALELAEQVQAGMLPAPARVVVPLGTGGTAAGLLLGFAIAELDTTVVAARCGPHIGSSRRRVLSLARQTRKLLRKLTGQAVPDVSRARIVADHASYGGAYGRPNPTAEKLAASLQAAGGPLLDSTYGAKALLSAMRSTEEPTVLWVTFDAARVS